MQGKINFCFRLKVKEIPNPNPDSSHEESRARGTVGYNLDDSHHGVDDRLFVNGNQSFKYESIIISVTCGQLLVRTPCRASPLFSFAAVLPPPSSCSFTGSQPVGNHAIKRR